MDLRSALSPARSQDDRRPGAVPGRHVRRLSLCHAVVLGPALLIGAACAPSETSSTIPIDSVVACSEARGSATEPELPLEGRRKEFFSRHPLAQLQNRGGRVLESPRLIAVFFDGDQMHGPTTALLKSYGCTPAWRRAVNEYGVGDALYERSVTLSEFPAVGPGGEAVASQESFQAWSGGAAAAGVFGPLTDQSVLLFFLPPGRHLVSGDCAKQLAAHSSFTTKDGRRIPYAYFPSCSNDAASPIAARSHAVTHELIEIATDPDPLMAPAWAGLGPGLVALSLNEPPDLAGESADLCEGRVADMPDYPFVVARGYSNRAARAGLDPCDTSPSLHRLAGSPRPADIDLSTRRATLEFEVFDDDPSTPMVVWAYLVGPPPEEGTYPTDFLLAQPRTARDGDTVSLPLHFDEVQSADWPLSRTWSWHVRVDLCDQRDTSRCAHLIVPVSATPEISAPVNVADGGVDDARARPEAGSD
jgi:hypothetical protein